ncbi:hypothetical protein FDP41_001006 [Naegleria fowleri]|uniref:BTB domain-containing protein n=1 Tax=Naegleria fowleri TaxID=5763 RepID=A0A6A5BPA5_NAEFO|nr:uncharacterized protein FDP41_001006 [Naegleria fowleri]KAF0979853.1 hypothetical protein FDP41_001006 [Naegleria fowleri]CAG4712040.1 unnamed protein product [Naegleria fowleri]
MSSGEHSLVAFIQSLWNDPTLSDFEIRIQCKQQTSSKCYCSLVFKKEENDDHCPSTAFHVHQLVLQQSPIFAKYFRCDEYHNKFYIFQCDGCDEMERLMASVEFAFKLVYGYSFTELLNRFCSSVVAVEKVIDLLMEFQFYHVLRDVVNDLKQEMNSTVESAPETVSLISTRWMTLWRTFFRLKLKYCNHQQEIDQFLQSIMAHWSCVLNVALNEEPGNSLCEHRLDSLVKELSCEELEAFLNQIPFDMWNTVKITDLLLAWMKSDIPNRASKVGHVLNAIKHKMQCFIFSKDHPPVPTISGFANKLNPKVPPPPPTLSRSFQQQPQRFPQSVIDIINPPHSKHPLLMEENSDDDDWDDDW